ncbi:MAG: glutathione S-transferase family protein [Paracoccaceae bacterium]
MPKIVTLYSYTFSVYSWIARLTLHEKGIDYTVVEVNPFASGTKNPHPFGRVPVLRHGDFSLYETNAITRYIDTAFQGPSLTPAAPAELARMTQIIAILDSYGYWPMVRQVFSHGVFRPLMGETSCKEEVEAGLVSAQKTLAALEDIASEGLILNKTQITLADCHLIPFMDCFTRATDGARLLATYPALSLWWNRVAKLQNVVKTRPQLPV